VITGFIPVWLKDDRMRTYEGLCFDPSKKRNNNYYNSFTDLAINTLQLENYNEEIGKEGLRVYLENLELLCGGEEEMEYAVKWKAQQLQKPEKKTLVAIVYRSDEGTGKTLIEGHYWGKCVIGDKWYRYSECAGKEYIGQFNANRENGLYFAIDEMTHEMGFRSVEEIKTFITSDTFTLNDKHEKLRQNIQNFGNVVFFTNNQTPLCIGASDRRFQVFQSNNKYADASKMVSDEEKNEYKKRLFKYCDYKNPCFHTLRAIRDYFMGIDISNFHPEKERVYTELYIEMKMSCMKNVLKFLWDYTKDEKLVGTTNIKKSQKDLYDAYKKWQVECNPRAEVSGKHTFLRQVREFKKTETNDLFISISVENGYDMVKWSYNEIHQYLLNRHMLLD
jgi:hypothetical protein